MLIIPAIDIIDGKCVRLYQGDYGKVTSYDRDPAAKAQEFEQAGAKRIHIVDLDAARGGADNRALIRRIRKRVNAVLELGGGIRTEDDIEAVLEAGIDRLILGTVFAKNPGLCGEWALKYGDIFIAGIDAYNGEVKVSGWEKGSGLMDTELAEKAGRNRMCSIIYTSISRDGTLEGPDLAGTSAAAEKSGLPVIVSGGISSAEDIAAVSSHRQEGVVIAGAITGKALYENRFSLKEIIEKYQTEDDIYF